MFDTVIGFFVVLGAIGVVVAYFYIYNRLYKYGILSVDIIE